MRNFLVVLNFELRETLKKKSMIITTIVLAVISFIIACIPMFASFLGNDLRTDGANNPGSETPEVTEKAHFDAAYTFANTKDYTILLDYIDIDEADVVADEATLKQMVENGDVEAGFVISSLSSFKHVTIDQSVTNQDAMTFEGILRTVNAEIIFGEYDLDINFIYETINNPIEVELITLGKNSLLGMPIGFIIMFVLYMIILLYGNSVSSSVAREKDSRTMELLITSTDTKQLILGKVLAAGLAGVIQMSVIMLGFVLGFVISKGYYPEILLAMLQGQMSLDVIAVYAIFSVSGYILYLFIFAALGSLVSKVEDVAGVTTPITMLFVIAYLVASMSMQMPDSTITTISSYIPFISIFTMPIRYMLTSVSMIDVFISLAIMLVTCYLLSILSIKIYRYGSLNYGNRLKLRSVLGNLMKERKK